MNKDESDKCIEIGKRNLREGNIAKALRFFEKAERLHPDPSTAALIKVCKEKETKDSETRERRSQEPIPEKNSSSSTVHYTPEQVNFDLYQVAIANKVLKLKDFYEILGVNKESPPIEIKKAYRQVYK